MPRLTGHDAIEYALAHELLLSIHAIGPAPAAVGTASVLYAMDVASEDASLVYLDVPSRVWRIVQLSTGADMGLWIGDSEEEAERAMNKAAGYPDGVCPPEVSGRDTLRITEATR